MRCAVALVCVITCLPAHAQCTWDADARTLSDGVMTLRLAAVGESCSIAILDGDRVVSPRQWYYCVSGDMQTGKYNFRSTGPVQSITPLDTGPERASVRVDCLTDDPDDPDRGVFAMTYTVQAGRGAAWHEMTFTARDPIPMRSYDFYVATEEASAETHRLHVFERGTQVGPLPVRTSHRSKTCTHSSPAPAPGLGRARGLGARSHARRGRSGRRRARL